MWQIHLSDEEIVFLCKLFDFLAKEPIPSFMRIDDAILFHSIRNQAKQYEQQATSDIKYRQENY